MAHQQCTTAAEQLWEALHESRELAASLKAPCTAVETCKQLAELLDTVSALLSRVFSAYRDGLFIHGLNSHLQSSAQLLHFGLLKASRLVANCCNSPGPCANSNSNTSPCTTPEALQSTAASAAADIQLAVTVLATAVQYLEATQTLKQAEAAAVQYISSMNTIQLLQYSRNTAPSCLSAESASGAASLTEAAAGTAECVKDTVELPCPAALEADVASEAAAAGRDSSCVLRAASTADHKPRSSLVGEPKLLQDQDAAPAAAPVEKLEVCRGVSGISNLVSTPFAAGNPARLQEGSSSSNSSSCDLAGTAAAAAAAAAATAAVATAEEVMASTRLDSPAAIAAAAASTAEHAVEAVRASLEHLHQLQQQEDEEQLQQISNSTAAPVDTAAALSKGPVATACSASATALLQTCDAVPMAAYDAVRLQALKELLVPGSTWSVAEDGGNFQYVCSPSSTGLRWQRAQQQQQQQQQVVRGEQHGGGSPEQVQADSKAASSGSPEHVELQPPAEAAAAMVGSTAELGAAGQQQSTTAQGTAEPELMNTSIWLQQQLQQVYSNPLLQGPKQQQQRHALLRRSFELSSGTAPSSNLQGFAADSASSKWGTSDTKTLQQQQQDSGSLVGQGLGYSCRSTGTNPGSSPASRSGSRPGSRPGSPDLGRPSSSAAAAGFSRLSSDLGFSGLSNPRTLRGRSEPGVVRISAEQLVDGLLGGGKRTASSVSGSRATGGSARSSLRDSVLAAEGYSAAAAARRSTGGSSSAAWVRSGSGGSSKSAGGRRSVVTSAVGATVVQMLAGATAGGLAAVVQQQLADTYEKQYDISRGNAGSRRLSEGQEQMQKPSSQRYFRKTTDGVLGYKTDGPVASGVRGKSEPGFSSEHVGRSVSGVQSNGGSGGGHSVLRAAEDGMQGVVVISSPEAGSRRRSSSAPRRSNSSSSGIGYADIYRGVRSNSRSRSSSSGGPSATAAAGSSSVLSSVPGEPPGGLRGLAGTSSADQAVMSAARGPSMVQRLSSSRSSSSGRAGDVGDNKLGIAAAAGQGDEASEEVLTRKSSNGLEALLQQQQQRWQQQREHQEQRHQQQQDRIGPAESSSSTAAAAAEADLQMTMWERQQQLKEQEAEQQWQQQQKTWQQQQQGGSESGRASSSGNMQELSFSACGSPEGQRNEEQKGTGADSSSSNSVIGLPAISCQPEPCCEEQQHDDTDAATNTAMNGEQAAAAAEGLTSSPVQRVRASGRGSGGDSSSDGSSTYVLDRSSYNRSSLMTLSTSGAAAAGDSDEAPASQAAAAVVDPAEAAAQGLLSSGNAAYTAGDYAAAARNYRAAMDQLGGSSAGSSSNDCYGRQGLTVLLTKCSLNMACCHLRLGQYKQCLGECDAILEVDPFNVVALCHRARALLMLQQPSAAKADLLSAQELLAEEGAGQQQQQRGVRALSPNTLARMRLNNSYWQERVEELLSNTAAAITDGK